MLKKYDQVTVPEISDGKESKKLNFVKYEM